MSPPPKKVTVYLSMAHFIELCVPDRKSYLATSLHYILDSIVVHKYWRVDTIAMRVSWYLVK